MAKVEEGRMRREAMASALVVLVLLLLNRISAQPAVSPPVALPPSLPLPAAPAGTTPVTGAVPSLPPIPPPSVTPPPVATAPALPPSAALPPLPAEAPIAATPPAADGSYNASTPLDPSQVAALESLGVPVGDNPCLNQLDILTCDQGTPFRQLTQLSLKLCPVGGELTTEALRNLSTVKTLSFQSCPFRIVTVPQELLDSVTSLTVQESLGRTLSDSSNVSGLSSVWLSRWYNLEYLKVTEVLVNTSSAGFIIDNMTHVETVIMSSTMVGNNLTNARWPANLTTLDLSFNSINGTIPVSLGARKKLQTIELSDNKLTGVIPSALGELPNLKTLALANNLLFGPIPESFRNLTSLQMLDLSNNRLNDSVPAFLQELPDLRSLDMRNNSFKGPLPFNSSFIAGLNQLLISGNLDLCYNSSILQATDVKSQILPCGPNGLPPRALIPLEPSSSPAPSPLPSGSRSSPKSKTGPKTIVVAVAASLGAVIIIIVAVICIHRWCSNKD